MIIRINENQRSNHSFSHLDEASRRDLITKSRTGSKKRYKKRLNYQVSNFKGVDLSELFNNNYLVFTTPIKDYVCTIAFPGVLTELREVVESTNGDARKINYQMVLKALRRAFDKTDDVKVRCTCPDFKYRFMYWADHYGYLYGPPTPGTEEFPDITNPDDSLGATCKHLNLFLSNKRWLIKAASVVNSLIKTYPDKAAVYLYDEEEIVRSDEVDEKEEDEITDKGKNAVGDDSTPEESPSVEDQDEEVNEEETDEVEIADEEESED